MGHQFHIGCSGWNYRGWRGGLYPQREPARRWLEIYSQHFGTVEVNATFYRLPTEHAVRHWAQQTGEGFLFALKASRYITHVKRLIDVGEVFSRLHQRIEPLIGAGKLGPILWQLPQSFQRDEGRLAEALSELARSRCGGSHRRRHRCRHAFEFRHKSWFEGDVYDLLREHDVALVLADHPERPFQADVDTASFRYLRLHYGRRGRRGNYSERELDEWAGRLREIGGGKELFVYFNNDWEGFAPRNASYLARRLMG